MEANKSVMDFTKALNPPVTPQKRGPRKPKTPNTGEKPKRQYKPKEPKAPRSKTPVNNLSRKVVHAGLAGKRPKLDDKMKDKDYQLLFGEAPIAKP